MTTTTAGRLATVSTAVSKKNDLIRRLLEWGGFGAAVILIAFGIGAIVLGANGRSTVGDSLSQEKIVGTPDMTPAAIKAEAQDAGLNVSSLTLPDKSVANQAIDSGDEARTFAQYMRIHALEATGGYAYAEMGRYEAKRGTPKSELAAGGGTNNEQFATVDPQTNLPVDNSSRDIWVTETALTTALNASYMADQVSVFGIVVGVALLLSGIGFGILSFAALHRRRRAATSPE